jgi:hypothetical protein
MLNSKAGQNCLLTHLRILQTFLCYDPQHGRPGTYMCEFCLLASQNLLALFCFVLCYYYIQIECFRQHAGILCSMLRHNCFPYCGTAPWQPHLWVYVSCDNCFGACSCAVHRRQYQSTIRFLNLIHLFELAVCQGP